VYLTGTISDVAVRAMSLKRLAITNVAALSL
jgi:hypothetical protein